VQIAIDPRHTGLQRRPNHAMAYLMLKTGLREIEVSRPRHQNLQPGDPDRYGWLYGTEGKEMADTGVKIVPKVYRKIRATYAIAQWI